VATSFSRSLRSLRADRLGSTTFALVLGVALLLGWIAWSVLGRVAVYEVSSKARLEVDRTTHPVQAPFAGKVLTSGLVLGREVELGDVLFELEANTERLKLAEARAKLDAITPELEALRKQVEAESQGLSVDQQSMPVALGEARARRDEAEAAARQAEDELARVRQLRKSESVAELELLRAEGSASQRRSAADAFELAVRDTELSKRSHSSDRRARVESLGRDVAVLDGERLTTKALIDRLEDEIERRVVRAPVTGVLAEVDQVTVGSVVSDGQRLGAIVPPGSLRLVADYPPSAALGRIATGQPARLRLDGFPWMQFGTVPATVTGVSREVRDGNVRVELSVQPIADSKIPLQHGLPGAVEIEIERASPATLVLRAAGKLLSPQRVAAP
jgi:multidrug resistance efflux pump